MADYYTWAEYVAEVKKLLPIEAQRVGIGTTATDYLTSLIRQAVIDLQRVIPGFQLRHETIYDQSDLVREGMAMRGVKPPQSSFKDLSIFRVTDDQIGSRFHSVPHPWEKRFDLVYSRTASNDGSARHCIDPEGSTFYVYPIPEGENWKVSMFWNGQKLNFRDEEQVPFTEASCLAVMYFVKAHTSAEVEDNVQNKIDYKREYELQKPKLYISDKESRGE